MGLFLLSTSRVGVNFQAPAAQSYVAQLQAEQAAFVSAMQAVLPDAKVGDFINETGATENLSYYLPVLRKELLIHLHEQSLPDGSNRLLLRDTDRFVGESELTHSCSLSSGCDQADFVSFI
jgi:hypothetical protein